MLAFLWQWARRWATPLDSNLACSFTVSHHQRRQRQMHFLKPNEDWAFGSVGSICEGLDSSPTPRDEGSPSTASREDRNSSHRPCLAPHHCLLYALAPGNSLWSLGEHSSQGLHFFQAELRSRLIFREQQRECKKDSSQVTDWAMGLGYRSFPPPCLFSHLHTFILQLHNTLTKRKSGGSATGDILLLLYYRRWNCL